MTEKLLYMPYMEFQSNSYMETNELPFKFSLTPHVPHAA